MSRKILNTLITVCAWLTALICNIAVFGYQVPYMVSKENTLTVLIGVLVGLVMLVCDLVLALVMFEKKGEKK